VGENGDFQPLLENISQTESSRQSLLLTIISRIVDLLYGLRRPTRAAVARLPSR